MHFIISRVNIPISNEQEIVIKSKLGRAIELVPGKSEQYLLLGFEDNYHLYLKGDNSKPIAYITASIFGNEQHLGYDEFAREVTKIFNEVLNIPIENIYIKFDDISDWSVAGQNIDRNRYL